MIGRGALRAPWLFRRGASLLATGRAEPEPTESDKLEVIRRHLELLVRHAGKKEAVRCMQQRISWYGKTMGHIKPLKEAVRLAESVSDMLGAIEAWDARPRRDAAGSQNGGKVVNSGSQEGLGDLESAVMIGFCSDASPGWCGQKPA